MDGSDQKINLKKKLASYGLNWHYEILPRQTKKALMFLSEEKWLKESNWYLAGGTALVLQARDIAVMKITAISQRGRKRDFFDLYWCAKNIEPLEEIIKRLKVQYPSVAHDYHHILKSLVYFEDAESDPEPEINFDTGWKKVKNFFIKEIPEIADKIMK